MAENQDEEESRKVRYPLDPNSYQLLGEIGRSASSVTYKASCIAMSSSTLAIKVIDLDLELAQSRSDFVSRSLITLDHNNILNAHCYFHVGKCLWFVMPFMNAGSVESIMAYAFHDGISEKCIAVVLKEILSALAYAHGQGQLHKHIKAGNILISSDGSVKLADFGGSVSSYESNSSHGSYGSSSFKITDSLVTPYWVAPEGVLSRSENRNKFDIWAFGVTALELAYGRPPLSKFSLSKSAFDELNKRFCVSGNAMVQGDMNKEFSEIFKDMVGICLEQDPSKRASAEKLLRHAFFKECNEGPDFLVKNMLEGLPNVEQRFFKEDKNKGQSLLDNKGDQEGSLEGENAKHKRIIGWNFNVERCEMEPVFAAEKEEDGIVKQVRFGDTTVIQEEGSGHDADYSGIQSVAIRSGNGEGVSFKEALLKGLWFLKKSLEDQKAKVMHLIASLGGGGGSGEVSREEELMKMNEELRKELEKEKEKNIELQIELELLKLHLSDE